MRMLRNLWAVIGAISLCSGVSAQDQAPLAVLEALPRPEVLGGGWSRDVSLLFDPASQPAEIIGATARLPDSFRKEKRDAVENPTNRISGWAHAHFEFQATNRTAWYEVQVDRYRSKQKLAEDFAQLLAFNAEEYQKKEIQGIGEAAVVYRHASGMTLWFRRGTFRVWISPMNSTSSWENDSGLQHLTRAFDKRLDALLLDKKTQPEPKAGNEK
jgi:hypothetical protein